MSWSRIKVTIRNTQISAYFCANPVRYVFLIHRMPIGIILSRSRNIEISRFNDWLYAKSKFRLFSNFIIWFRWVSKIKITQNLVAVRRGSKSIRSVLFLSFRCTKSCSSVAFLWKLWIICLGTNRQLASLFIQLELLLFIEFGFINYLE